VYVNAVVRPTRAAAVAAWDEVVATHHPLAEEAPLHAHGSPDEVAAALQPWFDAGVGEVVLVLRTPYDTETIDALPEIRAALRTARG
jgi:alkanesulfonate monooxygenase SsuD/methylene tetrahydromethanopterin reductase-like flavin-dependent oxidoreductase (luciferase family)